MAQELWLHGEPLHPGLDTFELKVYADDNIIALIQAYRVLGFEVWLHRRTVVK